MDRKRGSIKKQILLQSFCLERKIFDSFPLAGVPNENRVHTSTYVPWEIYSRLLHLHVIRKARLMDKYRKNVI